MEANICDISHLDADVLLPPRKRLLAGFKKQNSDGETTLTPPGVPSSSSSASPSRPSWSPPSQSAPHSPSSSEYQTRLNNLLRSHLNNNHNLSPEQIVQASKSTADAALKAAEAARASAQEKAILAAKAVAAAKNALALVASFPASSPEEAGSKERNSKKNKLKKHVQLQLLYKKHQPVENSRDDEELAKKLHRVMNSSPRISKNSSSSDSKGHKNKKLRSSPTSERTRTSNGGDPSFTGNDGHNIAGELDSEGSIGEVCTSMADEKISKHENNREAESSHMKEKISVDAGSPSKRRGRQKLKKLPLSICSSRDQANPKDDIIPRSSPLNTGNPSTGYNNTNKAMFGMEPSGDNMIPIEVSSVRKCQELKSAATCVKQNKGIQS